MQEEEEDLMLEIFPFMKDGEFQIVLPIQIIQQLGPLKEISDPLESIL